ncbi:O71 family O-antigen flippase, partial [Escherichia coli]|nr:O71 family O-antigen flippase [Escherichia coli]
MSSFFKISFFSGCLTLFKMLMGFLIAKVIAIYTGPSGMALLGQLQSLVTGINGIVNAPVGNGIVKYTAEFKLEGAECCSRWWKPAIGFSFLFCLVLSIVFIPFANKISFILFGSYEYDYVVIIAVCNLPFAAFGTMIMSIVNGMGKYRLYILYGFISNLITSIIMLLMLIKYGIVGALLATSIQYGLIGIILICLNYNQEWFKHNYFYPYDSIFNSEAKDILAYILMAITSAISLPLTLIVIRKILLNMTDITTVGQWQAVWKISEVYIGVVTIALSTYFLPKLSALNDTAKIKNEIGIVLKYTIPFVCVAAVLIFAFRDLIITLLFTNEFYPARDLFFIQLVGDIIKIISWIYAFTMLASKATRWYVGSELFFCISWCLISFVLVNIYKAQGINI